MPWPFNEEFVEANYPHEEVSEKAVVVAAIAEEEAAEGEAGEPSEGAQDAPATEAPAPPLPADMAADTTTLIRETNHYIVNQPAWRKIETAQQLRGRRVKLINVLY